MDLSRHGVISSEQQPLDKRLINYIIWIPKLSHSCQVLLINLLYWLVSRFKWDLGYILWTMNKETKFTRKLTQSCNSLCLHMRIGRHCGFGQGKLWELSSPCEQSPLKDFGKIWLPRILIVRSWFKGCQIIMPLTGTPELVYTSIIFQQKFASPKSIYNFL